MLRRPAQARNTIEADARRRRMSAASNSADREGSFLAANASLACGGCALGSFTGGERSRRPRGTRGSRTFSPMKFPANTGPCWADAHLDLAYLAVNGRDMRASVPADAAHALTLPALRDGGVRVAFGTIFTELGGNPATEAVGYRDSDDLEGAHRAGLRQLEWYEEMERAGEIAIVRSEADYARALAGESALGIVLLMECADPIRSPDEVQWWHGRGLRVVGLSWGHGSRYAGGNARAGGLTPIGRRMVEALDAQRILHDASHLSRAAFDDLFALSPRMVIASHSNAAALIGDNERHLTDGQIAALRDRDGWIGLNLYGRFLANQRRATLDDCVAQVMHVAEIVGFARVGLGSDLDGGFDRMQLPIEIQSPSDYELLLSGLERAGFLQAGGTRDGYAHANLSRVLRASGCL